MSVSLQQPVTPVDADVAAARPPRPRAALAVAMFGFAIALRCRRSFTVPPVASLLLDAVAARQAGIASGLLNTFRQMGAARSASRSTAPSSPPKPASCTACGSA